jgi:hypothetical protein
MTTDTPSLVTHATTASDAHSDAHTRQCFAEFGNEHHWRDRDRISHPGDPARTTAVGRTTQFARFYVASWLIQV